MRENPQKMTREQQMAMQWAQMSNALPAFRDVAPRSFVPNGSQAYAADKTITFELEKTGFLAGLFGIIEINFDVAAGTTAATAFRFGVPSPERIVKNIVVRNNQNFKYFEGSLYDLYLANRSRRLFDYRNPSATFDSGKNIDRAFGMFGPSVPTNWATGGNFSVGAGNLLRLPIDLRLILGERELEGLVLLEGRGTVYVDIVFENVATKLLTLTGTTALTNVSGSVTMLADTFLRPQGDPYRQWIPPFPLKSGQIPESGLDPRKRYQRVVTMQEDGVVAGTAPDNIVPTNGGTLLRATVCYYAPDNTALVAAPGDASSSALAAIANDGYRLPLWYLDSYELSFGGILRTESADFKQLAYINEMRMEGYTPPSGVFVLDYLAGNGDGARAPSMRDTLKLREVNDMKFKITPKIAFPAGTRRRVIWELLREVAN